MKRAIYVTSENRRPLVSVLRRGRLKRYRRMSAASVKRALRVSVAPSKSSQTEVA